MAERKKRIGTISNSKKIPQTAPLVRDNLTIFTGKKGKEDPFDQDRAQRIKEWRNEELKDYRVRLTKSTGKNPSFLEVAEALIACDGYVMKSAIKLGLSYARLNKLIKANPKLRDIVQDSTEAFLDLAENKLKDKILLGDTGAIIFALNNKGSRRGWTTAMSGELVDEKPVTFSYELALPPGCTLLGPDGKPLVESVKPLDEDTKIAEERAENQ